MWARHKYCGWVCMHCGHHARQWMSRQVHERRALRGLGCNDDGMKPNPTAKRRPLVDVRLSARLGLVQSTGADRTHKPIKGGKVRDGKRKLQVQVCVPWLR